MIDRMPVLRPHGTKLGRRHSCDSLELIGEVLNAAVPQLIGDLAQRQVPVFEEFLGVFNALENEIALDGEIFDG